MIKLVLILLVALIATSLPIAAVMGTLALFLDGIAMGSRLQNAFAEIFWGRGIDFILVVVPLFIMMGEIILRSGIADRMYAAVALWVVWLPGGLMHANIGASALFAATSGSSLATAATIGVTALPQIQRWGYDERLFLGSVAAGGTLGILIPPSMNMIIFGALTNTSVPQLFVAGVIPGLMLTALYMLIILVICLVRPHLAGRSEAVSWSRRLRSLVDISPPAGLFVVVIGSIYAGLATPTEAAAVGVFAALGLAAWNRRLNLAMLAEVMERTVRTSAMVTLILLFAFCLNFVIAAVGLVSQVNSLILGLGWSPAATVVFIIGIYVVMGMFMDAVAMVVLTVPVITPVVVSLGYDPVWFGVLIVLVSEMAILTPPVGMLCFVLQGIRGRGAINDIFVGVTPFLLGLALMLGLMLAFPALALWLPTLAFRS